MNTIFYREGDEFFEKYTIITAQVGDAGDICKMQIACAKETENEDLNVDLVYNSVQLILSKPLNVSEYSGLGDYVVVRSKESNTIVACCLIQLQMSEWCGGFYLHIESVYVEQGFRKEGIVSKLLEVVEQEAQRGRWGKVFSTRSTVDSHNHAMQKVIARQGWNQNRYFLFGKKL